MNSRLKLFGKQVPGVPQTRHPVTSQQNLFGWTKAQPAVSAQSI